MLLRNDLFVRTLERFAVAPDAGSVQPPNHSSGGHKSHITMTDESIREVRRELPGLLPRLWRFALVLSGDRAAAEDLVQATCMRALERAYQYQAGTRLDRWACTIMASIWRNQARSNARNPVEPREDPELGAEPRDSQVETNIFAGQVLSAVDQLPDGQRAAVAMVYIEGFSYREAAEALGIPIGTVMSRLAAARKTLSPLRKDGTSPSKE